MIGNKVNINLLLEYNFLFYLYSYHNIFYIIIQCLNEKEASGTRWTVKDRKGRGEIIKDIVWLRNNKNIK